MDMANNEPRRGWSLFFVGVALLALLAWGFAHAGKSSADWRSYVYSHARLLVVVMGFASAALRRLPSTRLQSVIYLRVLSLYSRAWEYAGTMGVITGSMVVASIVTMFLGLGLPPTASIAGMLATQGFNLSIVAWFAQHVAFHARRVIHQERLESEGARHTIDVWSKFLVGPGTVTLLIPDRPGGLLGHSTSAVRERLLRRLEVLKLAVGLGPHESQEVRAAASVIVARSAREGDVRGHLDIRAPTIVIGGPRGNPVASAFMSELNSRFVAEGGAGVPKFVVMDGPDTTPGSEWVEQASATDELGIALPGAGLALRASSRVSCGLAYFAWKGSLPICVIAGHSHLATEQIAKYVLNVPTPEVRSWAQSMPRSGVVELWLAVEGQVVTLQHLRRYRPAPDSQQIPLKRRSTRLTTDLAIGSVAVSLAAFSETFQVTTRDPRRPI
jgi:hypothetical protein